MAIVSFGTIQEFGKTKDANGDAMTVRIIPEQSDGAKTLELFLPFELRKRFKNIKEGECVLYAIKNDGTGIIINLLPDYTEDKIEDWDGIIRNEIPLQINGDVHIKGNIHVEKDSIISGNNLVEKNIDILGNISADGDAVLGKGLEIKGSNTELGGNVKIGGVTATGAKAFNGFPAGSDTYTGAPVSQDTVLAPPLAGQAANGNKGNYTKIDDNEEREG